MAWTGQVGVPTTSLGRGAGCGAAKLREGATTRSWVLTRDVQGPGCAGGAGREDSGPRAQPAGGKSQRTEAAACPETLGVGEDHPLSHTCGPRSEEEPVKEWSEDEALLRGSQHRPRQVEPTGSGWEASLNWRRPVVPPKSCVATGAPG